MAEIIERIQLLTNLPPDTHWFCPRVTPDDNDAYFEDDIIERDLTEDKEESEQEKLDKQDRIAKGKAHRYTADFIQAIQILAFDGEEALPYQESLKSGLLPQLTRCTVCVREFHRGRAKLEHELQSQYDTDQVRQFMQRFDGMNTDRIRQGLEVVKSDMLDLPPNERKFTKLSDQGLYALCETMHCMPVITNEEFLRYHFDQAFKLVQSKKKLTLPEYSPAITMFLFSDNEQRLEFALRCWAKGQDYIKGSQFDWAVKDQLSMAMSRVQITSLDRDFMPNFWRGARVIIDHLEQNVIAHHLRAMEIDICKLALEHLQIDSPCFPDLLQSLQMLLAKAPTHVWDALGAISPTTVIEQIFNSPSMRRTALHATTNDAASVRESLTWTRPFIGSLRPASLPNVCRSLLHHLWEKFQDDAFPTTARSVYTLAGLQTLSTSFGRIEYDAPDAAPAIASLLGVLRQHVAFVMENANKPGDASANVEALQVIRAAIAADVMLLALDRRAITQKRPPALESEEASTNLWQSAVRAVRKDRVELASAILEGCSRFPLFEALPPSMSNGSTDAQTWSHRLNEKHELLSDLFDSMQEFNPNSIDVLLQTPERAEGLLCLLFAGDKTTQQSAASLIKILTSRDSRSEAIKHVLEHSFETSMCALTSVLLNIAQARVFGPAQMTVKVGKDFITALSDSADGIVRTMNLTEIDREVVENVWVAFWGEINAIFQSTETWSKMGHEKEIMVAFCRDAMDFASLVFDAYSAISGALHVSAKSETSRDDTDRRLLAAPAKASASIVMWFRLRDEYLISKAIDLACKISGRLREVNRALPDAALSFIEQILLDEIRNKVPANLKAVLRRSFELQVDQVLPNDAKQAAKQGSLTEWMSSGATASTRSTPLQDRTKKGEIDLQAWNNAAAQRKYPKKEDKDLLDIVKSTSSTLEKFRNSDSYQALKAPKPAAHLQFNEQGEEKREEFRRKRQQALEEKKKRDAAAIAKARRQREGLGEAGSGLAGIGIDTKDHTAVKGEGVMVSSDESDGDDEGGLDADLFGSGPKTSKSKTGIKMDTVGGVGLKREVKPTKIVRQIRNRKDMRARLAPDLGPLHKIILGWDFFHVGDYPLGAEEWQFKRVSSSFRHAQEYRDTFQPLLTLEAWQAIVRSREEETAKPYKIKIVSRSSVDAFVEISTSVSHAELRETPLSEGDIILFSSSKEPTNDKASPNCLARLDKLKRKGKQVEIIYKCLPHNNAKVSALLKPGSEIFGAKVQSIVPLEREYGSISGLEYYDLCDEIVKARPSPLLNYSDSQLTSLISNYNVNKAQAKAVRSALDNDAFTLIQGPPGSGKTKTIVAIVGALLTDSLGSTADTTRIDIPRFGNQKGGGDVAKKLLVCAPSNAAVDELVMRFKAGIRTTRGAERKINVVRIGRSEAVNSAVQDVILDELVKKKLGEHSGHKDAQKRTGALMMEHKKVSDALHEARQKMDSNDITAEAKPKLQDEIGALRRRKNELGTQVDAAKDAEGAAARNLDLERRRAQQAVINESHIVCATLSGSGHEIFQSLNVEFETVVIDEAAQCVEMSALIPLKYGCAKCILVGDPKQLPPTVFSKEAARFQYEQSLFVRMQANHPDAVHLLDTQYRMHTDISAFPSASFYDGLLLDGEGMDALRKQPWHSSSLLAPYRFFDVAGQHESAFGHSLVNKNEIQVALALYARLVQDFPNYDFDKKIGIITPYKSQLRLLTETFVRRHGQEIVDKIEFNTTDAFQGRESEIIIFSCVRASPAGGIGFLQDIRRMNVGLTRAKSSLWVLGNSMSLIRGQWWRKLVENAKERDLYTGGNVLGMLQRPSSQFPAAQRVNKSKPATIKAEPIVNGSHGKGQSPRPVDLPLFQTAPKKPAEPPKRGSNGGVPAAKAMDKVKDVVGRQEEEEGPKRMDIDSGSESGLAGNRTPLGNLGMTLSRSATPRSRTATPDARHLSTTASAGIGDKQTTETKREHEQMVKPEDGLQKQKPEQAGARKAVAPMIQSKPAGPPLKRKAAGSVFMPKKKK